MNLLRMVTQKIFPRRWDNVRFGGISALDSTVLGQKPLKMDPERGDIGQQTSYFLRKYLVFFPNPLKIFPQTANII